MREPERVTKAKNPKKVAAGKAGAVARKKKQEKILEELRHLKKSSHQEPANPVVRAEPAQPEQIFPAPWLLIGGVVVVAAAAITLKVRGRQAAPILPPTELDGREVSNIQQHNTPIQYPQYMV